MFTQYFTCFVHKITSGHSSFQSVYITFQEPTVVIVRHEADLIAFCFFRQFYVAHISGQLAHLCFEVITQRVDAAAQAVLLQAPEHITLIFGQVAGFGEYKTFVLLTHLNIVSCCNELTIQGIGTLQ
ncbi:hypothetical protein D3C86_1383050 [compost metagenome]